jgi:hypothetical protein
MESSQRLLKIARYDITGCEQELILYHIDMHIEELLVAWHNILIMYNKSKLLNQLTYQLIMCIRYEK